MERQTGQRELWNATRCPKGLRAYAANLALPSLSEATARKLAVGESLVTHLTSLVLVDEEGPLQEGLPVTRKVNLPTPRTASGMWRTILLAPNDVSFEKNTNRRIGLGDPLPANSPLPLDGSDPTTLAPPSSDIPEAEKEEQCYRQAENLYLVTYWIDWKKKGSALAQRAT